MLGDLRNLARRTTWKQPRDLLGHLRGEFSILFSSSVGSMRSRHGTLVGVFQAFSLSLL
jgi:hypothetical protein